MQRLWSPWRSAYIETFKKPARKGRRKLSLFARAARANDDEANLVVWRGKRCFVMMNKFPYNSGHLMVAPYRQTGRLEDLTPEELLEMMQTAQRAVKALTGVLHPHGFNLGMNLGRVGGAGIADHIHLHIVPRWNGDTNFMPVLADTKVISEDIRKTLEKLRKSF